MSSGVDAAAAALQAVRELHPAGDLSGMRSADLLALNEAFATLKRAVDAAYLPVAAEIARQSRPELGRDSLARKSGFRTPAAMISTVTGTSTAEAMRTITVGESTAPRLTLTGEARPAKHPHVAAALTATGIGTLAAGAIIAMLDRVALRAAPDALDAMERQLVEAAPGLGVDQLQKLLLRAEATLDPDGAQPRDEQRRGERMLSHHTDRTGMVVLTGRLDPETAAPVVAAIEGLVTGMIRRREDAARQGDAALPGAADDRRHVSHLRADALAEICRHALGCQTIPTGPSTTVVVRMTLADLESGTGLATIDGVDTPVCVETARRMAADAQVIPCVLGGRSEILDWGRSRRLFTSAQKLALVERDGGCAFCGSPPGMSVVHHLRWWRRDAGPTDLDNGILLCTTCHHRIHDDGWEITIDGTGTRAKVWFVPPVWLDAQQRPRLGGRARFDLAA